MPSPRLKPAVSLAKTRSRSRSQRGTGVQMQKAKSLLPEAGLPSLPCSRCLLACLQCCMPAPALSRAGAAELVRGCGHAETCSCAGASKQGGPLHFACLCSSSRQKGAAACAGFSSSRLDCRLQAFPTKVKRFASIVDLAMAARRKEAAEPAPSAEVAFRPGCAADKQSAVRQQDKHVAFCLATAGIFLVPGQVSDVAWQQPASARICAQANLLLVASASCGNQQAGPASRLHIAVCKAELALRMPGAASMCSTRAWRSWGRGPLARRARHGEERCCLGACHALAAACDSRS